MRKLLFGILLFCAAIPCRGGMYAEHKKIGDLAFKSFIETNHLQKFFRDTLGFGQYGIDYPIPFHINPFVINYYNRMFAISDFQHQYSYGDLSALSGDHSIDPLQLFEGLFTPDYYKNMTPDEKFKGLINQLQCVIVLQDHAIDQDTTNTIQQLTNEGSYNNLSYIWLANEDKSHFQCPPKNIEQMLGILDIDLFNEMNDLFRKRFKKNPDSLLSLRKKIDKKFLALNNTAKYAILHAYALNYMNLAAISYCINKNKNKTDSLRLNLQFKLNFQFGLVFNACADHFLQDAFAAGHMPVKRSRWHGFHNKGVHDYYCRNGIDVQNEKDVAWHTYGDNFYDSITFANAIIANYESINDLWEYYDSTVKKYSVQVNAHRPIPSPESLVKKIIRHEIVIENLPQYLHTNFTSYSYIPMPLSKHFYKDSILLKNGAKDGTFIEGGANGYFPDIRTGIGWNIGVGLGYDITTYNRDNRKNIRRCGKNKETVYWVGGALNYSYARINDVNLQTATISGQFTYLDRLIAEADIGYIRTNVSYFLFRPMIGFELKTLRSPLAPSVKLFYNFSYYQKYATGLMLSLKLY